MNLSLKYIAKRTALASALFLLATQASRAATVSFTDTLPTADTILSNTTVSSSGNIQVRNLGSTGTSNRWLGSGFKAPTSTTLDRVTFFIYDNIVDAGALSAEMKISIYALSSQTAVPTDNSSPVYTEAATFPASYSNENYVTYNLDTPFALTADSNYGITLSFDTALGSRAFNLTTTPNNNAGTGNLGSLYYTYDQGATYTTATNPVNFVLQTIPEPTTYAAIFGFIALGAAFCYRRRQGAAQ